MTAPSSDVLDGGEGKDQVDYRGHSAAVRVDLVAQTGGAAGEADQLPGIEHAIGGDGDDVLVGDEGDNILNGWGGGRDRVLGRGGDDELSGGGVLSGGRGDDWLFGDPSDDVLTGGPGDDVLSGERGADRYFGGRGDDRIALHPSVGERVSCGPGRDWTARPGQALLPRGCETVEDVPTYPRSRAGGRLTFTIPRARHLRNGRVTLRLRGAGRRFVVGRFAGGRATARVHLVVPRAIRRLRRAPLPVEVRITARDARYVYHFFSLSWVIDLPR